MLGHPREHPRQIRSDFYTPFLRGRMSVSSTQSEADQMHNEHARITILTG